MGKVIRAQLLRDDNLAILLSKPLRLVEALTKGRGELEKVGKEKDDEYR